MSIRAAALALALALSACVSIPPVEGRYLAAGGLAVTLDRQWADISSVMPQRPRNVRLLTIDGPLLNRLYLASAITPGGVFLRPESRERPTPTFRADMTETELVEFVVDSVAALGYLRPEPRDLRPAPFGPHEGVRFEIDTRTPEGLDITGAALIARIGDALHVMLYLAPSEHYYPRNLPNVEAVFASVRIE